MLESFEVRERMISEELKNNLENSSLYSSRGDMNLFLGRFKQARSDYEMMIQIKPELEVSHWRLGIAYYYLGDFEKAAKQFEIYHNYDAVDRENGIWRFMSQFKKSGLEEARKGLLKYEKDDRPPYPLLYEMFAGRLEPEKRFLLRSKKLITHRIIKQGFYFMPRSMLESILSWSKIIRKWQKTF